METPWSAPAAIIATAITATTEAIKNFQLGDRGDRSDQTFPNGDYFSGHAN